MFRDSTWLNASTIIGSLSFRPFQIFLAFGERLVIQGKTLGQPDTASAGHAVVGCLGPIDWGRSSNRSSSPFKIEIADCYFHPFVLKTGVIYLRAGACCVGNPYLTSRY